ncbi:hypothetical protein PRK78_001571 [Emydomyces testavorans]|uniref:CID domain-containing protein n=1 Tax=Emydomyces testavorans TaxID=2070801 RepID=A0AAF0DED0_9EURO|nr:hypothetical protein PRK78_001571 [Emydomyces testavorans]
MTSHHVAIAKASFSAGLLRPDPTSVPRDEITRFHDALDAMLSCCSPANIQTCKAWILKNIVESANRVGILGKYLAALASSFETLQEQQTKPSSRKVGKTSPKRKRLHVLYLLNDLLHHAKYHSEHTSRFATLTGSLRPYLVELFALTAEFDRQRNPKHHQRLTELLDLWQDNGYYSKEYIDNLREIVANPELRDALRSQSTAKDVGAVVAEKKVASKNVPYVMPAVHGDPTAPYYELPAGNLLPHIIPNSPIPIKPQSVKALQFVAGPADETLVKAVRSLLEDVDRIYSTNGVDMDDAAEIDIDELGQIITRDEATGELIDGDAYYGWSRSFCRKMKQKRDGKYQSRSQSRSESRSRSRSRSRSYSPIKRRRYSESRSTEDGKRSRSRGSSGSRRYRRRSPYSRSPSRSRSPPRRRRRSRSTSRLYSPPPVSQLPSAPPRLQQQPAFSGEPSAPPPSARAAFNATQQHNQNLPQSSPPLGMFAPPPRPPNYHGPWPPPPPPPPIKGQHGFPGVSTFPQNINMNLKIPGFSQPFLPPMPGMQFVPPPPPPPPTHPQQGNAPNPVQGQHGAFQYPSSSQDHSGDGGAGGGRGGRGWSRGGGWS